MASRAFATPWEMRLSPPVTSWLGEMVLVMDFLILAASMPVITLKSTLRREIFRRSEILSICLESVWFAISNDPCFKHFFPHELM